MFSVLCQNYPPCSAKVGLHLDRLCGRGHDGRLTSTGLLCLLFSRFCATTSEMSTWVNDVSYHRHVFRNLKPWEKSPKIWLYPSHARHHRPQPTHLLSETMDLDGRSLKATELSEIPGDKVNIGQLTAIYGVVESRMAIDAWHCMAAKRLSRCQAACKSRKDSWPRCTGSPAAILASHRGE